MTDDSHDGRIHAEDREAGAEKIYIEAELVADTRTSEQQLGFRNVGARERRMLYQAEDTYVELLVPHEGHDTLEGGWLYGQFITPTEESAARFEPPMYAVLVGAAGMTGAAKMTPVGDFAVPYREPGAFELMLEPKRGPTVRVKFEQ
jgi:hypothetical protein